jgi:hypothetical protein
MINISIDYSKLIALAWIRMNYKDKSQVILTIRSKQTMISAITLGNHSKKRLYLRIVILRRKMKNIAITSL